jgi:hypothetical protein
MKSARHQPAEAIIVDRNINLSVLGYDENSDIFQMILLLPTSTGALNDEHINQFFDRCQTKAFAYIRNINHDPEDTAKIRLVIYYSSPVESDLFKSDLLHLLTSLYGEASNEQESLAIQIMNELSEMGMPILSMTRPAEISEETYLFPFVIESRVDSYASEGINQIDELYQRFGIKPRVDSYTREGIGQLDELRQQFGIESSAVLHAGNKTPFLRNSVKRKREEETTSSTPANTPANTMSNVTNASNSAYSQALSLFADLGNSHAKPPAQASKQRQDHKRVRKYGP